MKMRDFYLMTAFMALLAAACHAGLDEKALPLAVYEKMTISPAPVAAGDLVRQVVIDPQHSMKIVVKSPMPPRRVIVIPSLAETDDATPVFEKAIMEAKVAGVPAKLTLAPAKYYFRSLASNNTHWFIRDLADLTIEGNGATLIFTKNASGITFRNLKRVKLANVKIKYEGFALASLATLVRNGNGIYLKQDTEFAANYGAPIHAVTQVADATTVNNKSIIWLPNAPEFYPSQGVVNFRWDSSLKMYEVLGNMVNYVGKRWLVRHPTNGPSSIQFSWADMCEDVIMDGLTIYNSPGIAIWANNIRRGVALVNSTIVPDPNDRLALISSVADGFHTENNGGDILLENNNFSMIGDDSVNLTNRIKGVGSVTVHSVNEATYGLFKNAERVEVGHTLAMFSSDFTFLGLGVVMSVSPVFTDPVNGSTYNVRISSNVNSVLWGTNGIKDFRSAKYVRNLNLAGSRYYIARNTFHHHRGRGLLLQVPVGVAEENFIHNLTMTGIMLLTETRDWMEGFGVALVNVRNNMVKDMFATMFQGMITITSNGETLRNVTVEANTLRNTGNTKDCIVASNLYNLRVLGNTCNRSIRLSNSENVSMKPGVMESGAGIYLNGVVNYAVTRPGDEDGNRKTKDFDVGPDCQKKRCFANSMTAAKFCHMQDWAGLDDFKVRTKTMDCGDTVTLFKWDGSWNSKTYEQPKTGDACRRNPVNFEFLDKVTCYRKN